MSDQLDQVIGKITELSDLVRQRGGTQELDRDRLISDFTKLLEEHKTALLNEMPVRKGEIPPTNTRAVSDYKGKWAKEVRDIAETGVSKIGGYTMTATDFWMARKLLDQANEMKGAGVSLAGVEKLRPVSDDLKAVTKILTATTSSAGDELVPSNMATEIWQDMFTASMIANDLPQIPMPSDPFDFGQLGEVTWRKGGQGAATSTNTPTTSKSSLTSTEQIAEVDWTYNLDEDADVALMPELRRNLTRSGAEQMDAFVINADATTSASSNINLIDSTPASDAYYLSDGQDGIRHLALVDDSTQSTSCGGDALADADMTTLLNDLGKYAVDPSNVRIVPGIASYMAMLGLTNVATVDKYGPAATIVRGELARYRGCPVLPSASMGLGTSAGKYSVTAGSNTLGSIVAYNRLMWRLGFRRGLLIEVDRDIRTRQLIMVVSFRIAVGCYGTRSSATHTSLIYNHTV